MIRLERGSRLVIATHNPGKAAEFGKLLAPWAIECVAAGTLGLPAPEETAPDFAGNARIKALAAAEADAAAKPDAEALPEMLNDVERQAIQKALRETGGNRTAAARLLGMTFRQLRYRLQKLDIKP